MVLERMILKNVIEVCGYKQRDQTYVDLIEFIRILRNFKLQYFDNFVLVFRRLNYVYLANLLK